MENEKTPFRTQFKYRMRNLRLAKVMTQEAFASFLGLSRPTIGFYERADMENGRVPDAETLRNICEKCEVSADYLLGLSDQKAASEVSAYTGLSEEAVEALHRLSLSPTTERLAILDAMLTLKEFEKLLGLINTYLDKKSRIACTQFKKTEDYSNCKKILEEQGFSITEPKYEAKVFYNDFVAPCSRGILMLLEHVKAGWVMSGGPKKSRIAHPDDTGGNDGEHQKE